MRRTRPSGFTFLGAALFVIGFISLLSIIAGWQFGPEAPWQLYVYMAMDFLLCWGFFKVQYWLPLGLGLNWLSGAVLSAAKLLTGAPASWTSYIISFVLGGIIFYIVYRVPRGSLARGQEARAVGAAFLLLWATLISFGISTLL